RYPGYAYGDLLEIEGELETPPEFESFSYKDYLARQGIYTLLRYPQIDSLAQGQGNPLYAALYTLKDRAQATIRALLPEPEASLLSGILLGRDSEIPKDLLDDFNRTQTTHIIVISGFNIAIVAGLLSYIGQRILGRNRSLYFALSGIVLYTLLVGADPPVVRAAIMGGLYIIAIHLGRYSHALISLVVAAFLMTLLNPFTLWDLGFQLSFAATLGLILFVPSWQGWLVSRLDGLSWGLLSSGFEVLGESIIVTLAAQIWVLPIILHNFRQFSLVSLLSNALIVPAQAGVMILGGVATILGLITQPLGQVLAWAAWLPLAWTVFVVRRTAGWPWAAVDIGGFSLGLAVLFYGVLIAFWMVRGRSLSWRGFEKTMAKRLPMGAVLGTLTIGALLVWLALFTLPDGRLHVSFLDVGQGDSILIESPSGHQILVDGGPSPAAVTFALGKGLPFWDRSLDLVVLTHPQEDHLAGLIGVFERYGVGEFLYPGQSCVTEICRTLWESIEERGVAHREVEAGIRIELGDGVVMEVLHPPQRLLAGTGSDVNNNSVVLKVTMGRASLLLTGDIEEEGERALLASGQPLRSLVLKAPHHGAATSLTPPFLREVSPQLVIISVGENKFGHPAPETLARLSDLTTLRTDEEGTIEVVTDGARYWVVTER
ncbi:MAG: DNA internalization-related competence protein ComEC/Rec2, partial [Anaerolineae bacterium]